jgi:CBS domain containing-hemolysin-like protein
VKLIHLITFKLPEQDSGSPEEAVEELQSIIETAEVEDVLDEDQSELLQAAIDFADVSAMEVMTARVDVCAIDIEDDWEEIINVIEEAPYSRLPVYEGSVDNIIGVLYLNHFLKALSDGDRVDIRKLLMPPCYVYKTMKLPAVLNQLRRAKQHLAVVTDEYGGTLGVLSMEDVLEQIVGDIWDETDTVEQEMVCRAGASMSWTVPCCSATSWRLSAVTRTASRQRATPLAAGHWKCSAASLRPATALSLRI